MKRFFRGLGRNIIGLGLASFFTDLASEMATPLLPLLLEGLPNGGRAALAWIDGAAESVTSLLRIFSGWLSDRVGKRKPLIFAGYCVSGALRPLYGLARLGWHVGAIRIADRVCKAVRLAPRDALLADSAGPDQRGRAFGFQRAMDNLGGVLGMLIAWALLRASMGRLREVFFITGIPAVFVLGAVGLILRDKPSTQPPVPLRLSLAPFGARFRWFLFAAAVFTLGNSSDLLLISRLRELGLRADWVPLVWCGHTAIRMVTAIPAGLVADRYGKKRTVLCGWLVYAAVYAGLGLTGRLDVALVLVGLYGLYWSLGESLLRAIVADLVPEELRGTAYGLYWFSVGLAVLPANLLFSGAWSRWGARPAFLMEAGFALLASGLLLAVPVRKEDGKTA
ncbi:MAG TPA: MFS transporter [Planctomycetota bacterium]|nr:MFS transporter [Planctomycetota bacterium]